MTYRERREAKAERLRGWAAKREQSATATLKGGEVYRGDHAFNTQPGHIPERARLIAREDRAFASLDKAREMNARADGIERQAAQAIYSDDPDACEALKKKIVRLEEERDRMKLINRAILKGTGGWAERIEATGIALTDREKQVLLDVARFTPCHCKNGMPVFPPYALTNLGANIRRLKLRLDAVQPVAPSETAEDHEEPSARHGDLQ